MALPSAEEITTLPGSGSAVLTYAGRYAATAVAIEESANELRRLVGDTKAGLSEAMDALVSVSGDVADRLDKLHSRYAVAGSALSDYGTILSNAKTAASGAVSARDTAQSDRATAEWYIDYWQNEADTATDEADKADALERVSTWETNRDEADSALLSARQTYAQAVIDRDAGATTAAALISESIKSDGVNDAFWDEVTGFVAENEEWLKIMQTICSWAATILGVLSLICPFLAPFALVFAIFSAGLAFLLASAGKMSWLEFGIELLGALTFGVAAVALKGLKGTMGLLKSTRMMTVAANGGANPLRIVTGSFNGVLTGSRATPFTMLGERLLFGGIENANAMRVITNALAGAGGPADALLIGAVQMNVMSMAALSNVGLALGLTSNSLGLLDSGGVSIPPWDALTDATTSRISTW